MAGVMAAVAVLGAEFGDWRKDGFALLVGERATRMKFATPGSIEQAWHFALQLEAVDFSIGVGFRVGR